MAPHPRPAGPAAIRLAANLRRTRTERGKSTYALAAALKQIGWPIPVQHGA